MFHKTLIAIAAAASLAACASGTTVSAGGDIAPATPVNRNYLPAGTTMNARLNQSISTSSNEGDGFSATVIDNVIAEDGTVAVPAGAMLQGHVTGVHTAKLPGEQNAIRLNFDNLDMYGRSYPLSANISNVQVQGGKGVTNTTARNAAIGAGAGAVLGGILSGGEVSKMITGGLLGAAAGTVISMGTMGNSSTAAVIPAGSIVTVRSDQGIQVR